MKTKKTVDEIKVLLDEKLREIGARTDAARVRIVLVAPPRDNANWTVWHDWQLDYSHEIHKALADLKMQYDLDMP
jgi:hypothetical protein